MNEEIKEIKKIICNNVGAYLCMGAKDIHPNENYNKKEIELITRLATAFDNAGYRKQSDTVREFAEKFIKQTKDLEADAQNNKENNPDLLKGMRMAYKGTISRIQNIATEFGVEVE